MAIICDDCEKTTKIENIRTHNGGLVECSNCGRILFASCPRCKWFKIGEEEQSIKQGYNIHLSKKHPELVEKQKKIARSWRKKGKSITKLSKRFNRAESTIKKWINEDE